MKLCHKIGEDHDTVYWKECLICTLDDCIIWRLTRQYVIPKTSINTHDSRLPEEST